MTAIFELMDEKDLAKSLGQNFKLARVAKSWRQEDLAQESGASLHAIKNIEGGGNVELLSFLRVARALGMARAVWEGCQREPQTLDELERVERAMVGPTRVKAKRKRQARPKA